MKKVCIKDIDNPHFWVNYFGCSYPNAYDEEEEVNVKFIETEEELREFMRFREKKAKEKPFF